MSFHSSPTQFSGKTWIFIVQALVFGGLGAFGLVLGPLFLLGVLKPADGRPGTAAGIALTVMSVPFLLMFALAAFNVLARRRPILRVCREGLEINMIGSSSLDGVPLVPGLVRVAWLIISFQGFQRQTAWAPWPSFRRVAISGPPMARTLTISGEIIRPPQLDDDRQEPFANRIAFHEVEFDAPLDQVAATIEDYSQYTELKQQLPSWGG